MNILWNGFASNRGYSPPRDMANVEAIDFLKGPSAALYGSSEPGGTINVVTKKPQFKAENSVDLSVGTQDFYRSAIDSTGALNDKMAYRLNAAIESKGSSRDDVRSKREFVAPAFTWLLTDRTTLTMRPSSCARRHPWIAALSLSTDALTPFPRHDSLVSRMTAISRWKTRVICSRWNIS